MASGTRVVGTHVRLDGTYPVSQVSLFAFRQRFTLRSSGQIYGQDSFAGKGFLEALKERLSVKIISETEDSIEFDLVGVEAPLANALRRILLAEVCPTASRPCFHFRAQPLRVQVPTVAVESVYILDNSSIIQDEVLAHRLGLVPLNVDPRTVHYLNGASKSGHTWHYQVSH